MLATPPDPNSGADPNGYISLDVDVSMPDPGLNPEPPGGYPLMVMMHGCCWGDKTTWEADTIEPAGLYGKGDERWHYNNAWFAARGYVVLNYTSRGFVNSRGEGSTGETQIDSLQYEINDYQYLAGLLADDPYFKINSSKVVLTGGSMGGGLTWLALTEPVWKSRGGTEMHLAAVAPRYGWTDLLYSLVPTGAHLRDAMPDIHGCDSGDFGTCPATAPFGFPKQSILAAFYTQSQIVLSLPQLSSRATFPAWFNESFTCLNLWDPIETNPFCATFRSQVAPDFIANRSAYYQNDFFMNLASGTISPVPVYSAGTLTDPLFTSVEHRRMVERLKNTVPGYPVQEYYGDYAHFVQDKPKEWADQCGNDRHICTYADYNGDLTKDPISLSAPDALGVTTRLNRFIDYYDRPPGDPTPPSPTFDVTASLQVCPANTSASNPADAPGPRFTGVSFADLAPESLKITMTCKHKRRTTSVAAPNLHAISSDPLSNFLAQIPCVIETTQAGPGVATFDSDPLSTNFTMLGRTRVTIPHTGNGTDIQLNARLYDVFPPPYSRAVMVDRGVRRVANPNEKTVLDLDGNGWLFAAGHSIRIEVAQDNAPYVKRSFPPSSLLLGDNTSKGITLELPVRETSSSLAGKCR